jgi:ATP-dependent Clp protease adaptor protein ClpS
VAAVAAAPAAPAALPDTPAQSRVRHAPRWKVLLHNDETHDMPYVVQSLLKAVPPLRPQEAVQVMLQAHLKGVGLVRVCPREEAEYYQERIQTYGLGASVEPADE